MLNFNIYEGLNILELYCYCASLSFYMIWFYGKFLMFKESEIFKSIFCFGIIVLSYGFWDDIIILFDLRCKMCYCEYKKFSFDCL